MVRKSGTDDQSTEVENIDGFSEDALGELESISDVLAATGGTIPSAADVLGNGFGILEDKMRLVNVEFIIVKYGEHTSEKVKGKKFATIHVITRGGDKYVVNDGSTGIMEQLRKLKEDQGHVCPLYVPRGLRVSDYEYEDPNTGEVSAAQTFYLNTAK